MSIEKLKNILLAPDRPVNVSSHAGWSQVEEQLGISLPAKYKEFIMTYGSGSIDNFITIFNPFSKNDFINLDFQVKTDPEGFSDLKNQFPDEYYHDRYPTEGGLIPFGATDNGEVFYWQPLGNPSNWAILAFEARGSRFDRYEGAFSDFLIDLIERKIRLNVLPDDFPPADHSFKSYARSS